MSKDEGVPLRTIPSYNLALVFRNLGRIENPRVLPNTIYLIVLHFFIVDITDHSLCLGKFKRERSFIHSSGNYARSIFLDSARPKRR